MHRPCLGQIKTVTIRRDGDQWYACFSVVQEVTPWPASDAATGIDWGLTHFATLADGRTIENPGYLRHSLKNLARAQRVVSRCQRGSNRRRRAQQIVARLHRRVRNQRAAFCHKAARALVADYGTIVFEDLRIRNLVRNHSLALSVSDAGWGFFIQYASDTAACAGRAGLFVHPAYTSQNSSSCSHQQQMELSQRWYSCPQCDLELDRNHNAARNILRAGSA